MCAGVSKCEGARLADQRQLLALCNGWPGSQAAQRSVVNGCCVLSTLQLLLLSLALSPEPHNGRCVTLYGEGQLWPAQIPGNQHCYRLCKPINAPEEHSNRLVSHVYALQNLELNS